MTLHTTISMGQLVIATMAASMIGTTADAAAMTLASAGPSLEIGPAEQARPAEAPQRPPAGQRGGGPLRRGSGPDDDAQFTAEQTDRQTQVLALGSNGVLELRTFVGDVSVISGSGREVRLEIVRRSRGRTDADAKLGLEQVTAAIDHQGVVGALVAGEQGMAPAPAEPDPTGSPCRALGFRGRRLCRRLSSFGWLGVIVRGSAPTWPGIRLNGPRWTGMP